MPATPEPMERPTHDQVVVLRGVGWADYQRMLEIRADRSAPRFAYLEGVLEIRTPSRQHEAIKSMIGCLVEAWCFERGVAITPYGSWTLEDKRVDRGVEPDECYVIGEAQEPERPDLAIEVNWTSGGISKLEIYRKLGVREVWLWSKGQITPHVLRGEQYQELGASEVLAGIDLTLLVGFVGVKPMTTAVLQYRAALRGERPGE